MFTDHTNYIELIIRGELPIRIPDFNCNIIIGGHLESMCDMSHYFPHIDTVKSAFKIWVF